MMQEGGGVPLYRIEAVPKHYAWGSKTRLQAMFHLQPGEQRNARLAEMWFSGHPQSPSPLTLSNGEQHDLLSEIHADPVAMVGEQASQEFGPVMPYLFKIISAEIPLSLQVHPVDFEARAGFNRENDLNIALDAPERSFKDSLAKNEMLVALEPFSASVGFAPLAEQLRLLRAVDHPIARNMVHALTARTFHVGQPPQEYAACDVMMPMSSIAWPDSRRRIFRAFHVAITAPAVEAGSLETALRHTLENLPELGRSQGALYNAIEAAQAFETDASVLCLLMMNPVELAEGESVYIPAGLPHAYIHGTAAEIMTNSDNVLRAGMTVKHKDIANLLHSLNCQPAAPIDPSSSAFAALAIQDLITYRPKISEYMLAYGRVDNASGAWPIAGRLIQRYGELMQKYGPQRLQLPSNGPRVLLCTEGSLQCTTARRCVQLTQGEAVFIPAEDGHVEIGVNTKAGTDSRDSQGSYLFASTPF
ncbi:MAG: mannose-6-phosphate isomerase, class I [Bifidobacterium aquikefiri]